MKTSRKEGTAMQCWQDYASRLPYNQKHCVTPRRIVAQFCGVNIRTVERWIRHPERIIGVPQIAMRFFLKLNGYKVYELEAMDEEYRKLAELVAFRILDVNTLYHRLGYTQSNTILLVLQGKGEVMSDRLEEIRKVNRQYAGRLSDAVKAWQRDVGSPASKEISAPSVVPSGNGEIASSTAKTESFARVEITGGFINLVQLIFPYVRVLISAEFSAGDRKLVREAIGDQRLFELSTMLNQMCSETSLKKYGRDRRSSK